MKNTLTNKSGLTKYAFLCGYVQKVTGSYAGKEVAIKLFAQGSEFKVSVQEVESFNVLESQQFSGLSSARNMYKSYARKFFSKGVEAGTAVA